MLDSGRRVQDRAGECRSMQDSAGQCRTMKISAGQCRRAVQDSALQSQPKEKNINFLIESQGQYQQFLIMHLIGGALNYFM